MQDESISAFLGRLATRAPTPGGGAVAALQAGQAAALVGMVARYTTGDRYAHVADKVDEIIRRADECRTRALTLAAADEEVFGAVAAAHRLPRATREEQQARSTAIDRALTDAATPPAGVIALAAELVTLGERLLPIGNPSTLADLAAAVNAARAAASTSGLNIETNLRGIGPELVSAQLRNRIDEAAETVRRAEALSAAVRQRLTR